MNRIYATIIGLIVAVSSWAQTSGLTPELEKAVEQQRYLRLMFYNCENFFDTDDDPLTRDEEFTPEGERHWNKKRYNEKQDHVSQVVAAIGGWQAPDIIGLCEIESRKVILDLTLDSKLYVFEYKFLHKESPDSRGIDVALLYQPKSYTPIKTEFIPVHYPNSSRSTRDILFSTGTTRNGDTLHIFVNHWPSRWGGQTETDELRCYVASIVRHKVDSLVNANSRSNIIIMGDLNDYPNNNSVCSVLKAKTEFSNFEQTELYNLAYYQQFVKMQGTHKYDGMWGVLDQMIISGSLLDGNGPLYTSKDDAHIFNAPFLLENDDTHIGYKPFRTYNGYQYNGGFSDHLPVFINIYRK